MTTLMTGLTVLGMLTPPEGSEYAALIPGIIVVLTAVMVVLLDTAHRNETSRGYLAYLGSVGLGAALLSCMALWDQGAQAPMFFGTVYLDRFGLFFAGLACIAGIGGMLTAPAYIRSHSMDRGEYYMLVLFAVAGMIFMANAADLLTVFIGLEVMSIPVYCLAAFLRKDARSAEAGLKYFVLGAFSTGLLLYGIALVYGIAGTTNLEGIAQNVSAVLASPGGPASKPLLVVGVLLILSGFAFKVAAAPFHIWSPDVYTGSPTPVVAMMATGVKAAAFAAMLRVFVVAFFEPSLRGGFFGFGWVDALFALSALSMILGNLVALAQSNVKRMLAYSSVAHAGYILVGFVAAASKAEFFLYFDTVLFYMVAYTVGTIGAFGALAYLGRSGSAAETYDDLAGLGFKYPVIGLVLSVCMLSSAGIPPTAGFLGKLYVFRAAVDAGARTGESAFIGLAILGVLTSVAGVYYYLRVMVSLYMREPTRKIEALDDNGALVTVVVAGFATLWLGIFPQPAIELAREAIVDLQGAPASVGAYTAKGRAELLRLEGVKSLKPIPAKEPAAKAPAPAGAAAVAEPPAQPAARLNPNAVPPSAAAARVVPKIGEAVRRLQPPQGQTAPPKGLRAAPVQPNAQPSLRRVVPPTAAPKAAPRPIPARKPAVPPARRAAPKATN